jgi:hypothetical protein
MPTASTTQNRLFLCSELIKVFTSNGDSLIGNLEEIAPHHCSVLLERPIAEGTQVQIECLGCPTRDRGATCTKCRFTGQVQAQSAAPEIGPAVDISFHGRQWSRRKWRPQHLTGIVA